MLDSSPLIKYQELVDSGKLLKDPSQHHAIELLQQLYLSLHNANSDSEVIYKSTLENINGIYLWGKVGRGKTFLMDLLHKSLPSTVCKRQHFHHFMQDVHRRLTELSGKSEPLRHIAKQLSQQYKVLCFDEFFVSDIGDAMLLGNLLQYMFELNMVVVCTSNCAPNELYRNGLQRERFLPAIAAIKTHLKVVHLNGEQDHRKRALNYTQRYFELPESLPKQAALHQTLLREFDLTLNVAASSITVLGRHINVIAQSETSQSGLSNSAVCFDFSALCEGPRSHFDYVELAKLYKTILVFNVPPMSGQAYERIKARGTEDNGSNINIASAETGEREVVLAPMDDALRRFIALVDECYDSRTSLIMTAYVPQEEIYTSGSLMFEFERTKSRLVEMASLEFIASVEER
ncbi:cell division protein ZapE [Alteromonas sp. 1_MG-2023]|uniref:cell division protein ZapE n=1 Tax=Alteromonas sp. 1_MG-2023 TaxID=3062669 RepID=UPI0026E21BD1|nr:cell division protein ZapE [Alteromonas sp. 1_MG-2023]MDO6566422.1 cell division protein ZapE [Alteromonas sp. 1_MG-2023]